MLTHHPAPHLLGLERSAKHIQHGRRVLPRPDALGRDGPRRMESADHQGPGKDVSEGRE